VLITCEGTEIFWLDASSGADPTRDTEWHERLAQNWDQEAVKNYLQPYDEDLHTSELGVEGDFNADDTFRFAITMHEREKAVILTEAAQKQFGPEYSVFWSEAWVRGIYLVTVLPAKAGKRNAAEYVAGKLQDHFGPGQTVWAGDSDNDLPMLQARNMLGIVVGNSYSSRLRDAAAKMGSVYQAAEENAAGVHAGIEHFYGQRKVFPHGGV
jgi:hydroxymethylpyrimidine pyrophosphatase-like HAD family hydrolase